MPAIFLPGSSGIGLLHHGRFPAMSMKGKESAMKQYRILAGVILVGAIAWGCGGGNKSNNFSSGGSSSRLADATRFDVDVKSGKVIVTPPKKAGRAVFTGAS